MEMRAYTRFMANACICIALRKATRRVSAIYDEIMSPAGINVAQFSLMRNIQRNQPVSVTELGRITELDRSTVGRNCKVLERDGLVALEPSEDEREARLVLTDLGKRLLIDGEPLWLQAQEKVKAALSPMSITDFEALMARL